MAVMVPASEGYETERRFLNELEARDEVDFTLGLSNAEAMEGYMLADRLTPRQFAGLADLDYELAQAVYTACAAKNGDYGQINGAVVDTVADAVYGAETASAGGVFSDTSEEDIDAVTSGKIFACRNEAAVSGDICAGGQAEPVSYETLFKNADLPPCLSVRFLAGEQAGQEEAASLDSAQKKKRLLTAAGVIIAVFCAALICFFSTGMKDGAAACRLLLNAWRREDASFSLSACGDIGQRQFSVNTRLTRVPLEGREVLAAEQFGASVYYCDGKICLENGCVLDRAGEPPGYSALLRQIGNLYRAADLTVFENSGEKIYCVSLEGKEAMSLMSGIL